MGLVIRQSIYTTIISYVGVVVGYVNILYLFPKFLAPEQVGLLRTIQDAAILFSPFAQFGIAQSIFKFYPRLAKDHESEKQFISTLLFFALIGFLIFVIVFKVFQTPIISYFEDNASDVIQYANTILWLTFILLMSALLEAYSRSLLKTVVPNLIKEVVIRVFLALLVTCYFFGWLSYEWFIIASVLAYLACLLLLIGYLVIENRFAIRFSLALVKSPEFGSLVRYSFLSFAGAAGMIIIGKIDSIMVAALVDLAAVAVYTTGFYMATVIEIPKRAMSQVAFPLIARAFEKNDFKDIQSLYQKTAISQFVIGSLLLIGIYINLDNIFTLMPKREIYEAGRWVVIIVGIGKLTDMLFGPSSEIVVLSRYYWFNMVLIIFLAATVIVANNILIPIYGINGAAMGAALALILFNVAKFFFILWKLKMQPFNAAFLKVLIIGCLTLALDWVIPKIDFVILDILVRSGGVTIFYAALILATNVTPEANGLFRAGLKRIGLK